MIYLKDKIEAIKHTNISWLDQQYLDLIERVLTDNTASVQAKLNAELQLDKWYAEV